MGSVKIKQADDFHVEARVRGSNNYVVTLSLEDGQLVVFCDCPYFESNGRCKHIWATILETDKTGYLKEAVRTRTLEVVEESTDDDVYEYDIGGDEEHFDEPALESSRFVVDKPKRNKIRSWKEQLAVEPRGRPLTTPPLQTFLYFINF